jgi:hypothetical protein
MNQVDSEGERRKTSRKQMQFLAWVETAQNGTLPCTVLDMTLQGARLHAPDVVLPNEFTLLLDPKLSLRRRCRVAWRKRFTVGLQFVQASLDEQYGQSAGKKPICV